GVTVPEQRVLAKKYRDLPLRGVEQLLKSKYHEHRLTAVFILTDQFRRAKGTEKDVIAKTYLRLSRYVNN
ncbi:DNA alkylation repair protein, partial [Streptococcus suis]